MLISMVMVTEVKLFTIEVELQKAMRLENGIVMKEMQPPIPEPMSDVMGKTTTVMDK